MVVIGWGKERFRRGVCYGVFVFLGRGVGLVFKYCFSGGADVEGLEG